MEDSPSLRACYLSYVPADFKPEARFGNISVPWEITGRCSRIGLKTLRRQADDSPPVPCRPVWLTAWPTIGSANAATGPKATDPARDSASPKPPPPIPPRPASTPILRRPTGITGPTTPFHDSVASRYNYAFGKDTPFLPSNATDIQRPVHEPQGLPHAQYCGHCHQEAYHQWRESVHSNSFRAPWYLKNVNALIDEKGVQYSRHCEGCHNPVALLSGDLSQGMPKKRPFEQEGVTCSTCHSIISTDTTGTGSYVMGVPAVLVDEAGAPITGPSPTPRSSPISTATPRP
jgi:hypothetical protein